MKKFNKKILTVIIVFAVLLTSFSPVLAIKTNAQFVVALEPVVTAAIIDTSLNTADIAISTDVTAGAAVDTAANTTMSGPVKEFGLDAVAWMIANLIIERMTASTVNWINSGFKGSPAFITNPEAYFTNIGDQIAGQYIFSNPDLNFLCGPISAKIRLALTNSYMNNKNVQCTLTQVGKNMDNFMNKFENGGWDNFFELTQRTQNNPIGAYIQAQNEMNLQIATKQGTKQIDLNQGHGFLSYQKCKSGTERAPGQLRTCDTDYNTCLNNNKGDENNLQQCASTYKKCNANTPVAAAGDCSDSDKETVTPGSVIADQLNTALNTGSNKLVTADEINEIVSALLNQVVSQVVGGIGNGLRGLSQSSASNSGQSLTSQLSSGSKTNTTDYFGNAQDTSVGDKAVVPTYAGYQAQSNQNQNRNQNANTPNQNQNAIPLDKDCLRIAPPTLSIMAQESASSSGETLDQAMMSLDCPPPGIH